MAEANFGNSVKVNYAVKLDDGTVFDSTFDLEPLTFTVGLGQVIPGFDQAVIGMTPGTSKTIRVSSDEAYGPYNKELVSEVDRKEFPADFKFEVGQHLQIPQGFEQPMLATVLNVSESRITLDINHPLAGKDLTIDIQLIEIL
jgi:peptidylprolyl isomerase